MVATKAAITTGAPGSTSKPSPSRASLYVIGSIVILLLLWQVKKLHGALVGVGVLIVLGLLLQHYPAIRTQFINLGK